MTDIAVNAAGVVYVKTESVVYKAALPSSMPGKRRAHEGCQHSDHDRSASMRSHSHL